jgi:peroxiredoxin
MRVDLALESPPKPWMTSFLQAAGIYNIAWSALLVWSPAAIFDWAGLSRPSYPDIIQDLGLLTGLFGLGFLLAAKNPYRHWPVILIGMLSKLGGFAGLAWAVSAGHFPREAMWLGVVNDLVWAAPLAGILMGAYEEALSFKRSITPEILGFSLRTRTSLGVALEDLTRLSPVLLVFLRHWGCTFCREALADLARRRAEIEENGTRLVLVHMGSEEAGRRFFAKHGLDGVASISDPQRALYRAFGLRRGTFGELIGPKVWLRGFQSAVLNRHGLGRLAGDAFQMPGAFLLFHGQVLRSFRHTSASDRPDYLALVTGEKYVFREMR